MSLWFHIIAKKEVSVYDRNITGNLVPMADEAGVCDCLWRLEEKGYKQAYQIIPQLEKGLALLKSDPERFKKLNPNNGWGDYEGLVSFVEEALATCKEFPEGTLHAN